MHDRPRNRVFGIALGTGVGHPLASGRSAYLFIAEGEIEADGHRLATGDALEYAREPEVAVRGQATAEIILFDLPG
ncbi:MAG TPA: hypothetical protein QGH28_00765 [Chloroflexota bacterium]|nr:hypothetical protein [Chloroflexota bacterium]